MAAHPDAPPSAGKLLVLAGPTASGKTGVALALADRYPIEVISADSVQVYRGFDIGSAKPSAAEQARLPHHVIDVLDPEQGMDAGEYARLAQLAIADVRARGRVPVVVGGTGLWLRALLRGLVELPKADPALRAALEAECAQLGAPALHARLAQVDPRVAAAVHPNDQLRIVRGLEVYQQTGRPLGELQAEHALGARRYESLMFALDLPSDAHTRAIEQRLDAMLSAGLVDEVRALLERYPDSARAFGSVGYKEVVAHLRDGVTLDETRRLIRKATRVYARRQRTWLRSDPSVDRVSTARALLNGAEREALERFIEAQLP
ncbi:MAG: tRNA (adenosine(37)-N6)-dimethylallyltransferase MiaA [Myxococcales bacterium]|nr:tRNA (adenosine(37)-N6)-dimethylallyltransferase MiaA [Myxococcales bacterium]MCB9626861.1 tRNA (adenosine(37)-N6)-dimethylallyltransferase MiaA [Sandaracinaceae bacterium]